METHLRTLAKTFSWRLWATLITTVVAWIITGEMIVAATVGVVDTLVKLFAYYIHERLWNKVHVGRKIPVKKK